MTSHYQNILVKRELTYCFTNELWYRCKNNLQITFLDINPCVIAILIYLFPWQTSYEFTI